MRLGWIVLIMTIFMIGCNERNEEVKQSPDVAVYSTSVGQVSSYGHVGAELASYVFIVEKAPVDLRLYRVSEGTKVLAATLHVDPTIHPFAFVTPDIQDGQIVFRIGAHVVKKTERSLSQTYEVHKIELPNSGQVCEDKSWHSYAAVRSDCQ